MNKRNRKPSAGKEATSKRAQGDDKPPIIQPGPIIIKSGPDDGGIPAAFIPTPVDIRSVLFDFEDDGHRVGRHYSSSRLLRITSLLVETDVAALQSFDFSTANRVTIVVNVEP